MLSSSYHFSWQKRTLDVCLALTFLIFLFPLFCGVVLLVLATSGTPILFWQERLGHNKKPFKMLKFRTMRPGAEQMKEKLIPHNEAPWPMFKMKNDPRFTQVGRFLSRSGLDELPQFFQILTGEMSFVGPRPLPVPEAKNLPRSWAFRYEVKPGILSEWAIAPDRYASLKRWRELELETVKRGSLFNDLRIIGRGFFFMVYANKTLLTDKPKVRTRRPRPSVATQNLPIGSRKRAPLGSFA